MNIRTIESAIGFLSPDLPRVEWVRIAMAIKSEYPDEMGFSIFDTWSRGGATYDRKDCLSTWRSVKPSGGITIRTLFHLAKEAGWERKEPVPSNGTERKRRDEEFQKEQETDAKKRQYAIDKVLSECTSIEDTQGMDYLENRLDTRPSTPDLLFHPDLKYFDSSTGKPQSSYPAIIGKMIGPSDEQITLHRTYISEAQKAPVESPKKIMGVPWPMTITGAAIRLYGPTETLILAEGIETALALSVALEEPAWACASAHGLSCAAVPDNVKTVIIGGDNDKNQTGQRAASKLAGRLKKAGKKTRLMIPSAHGDWLDVLRRVCDVG